MLVTITGRHMTVTPALRRYLDMRLRKLERRGVEPARGEFVLVVEKHRHTAEGVVIVNGRVIQGKASTREMYASIDRLLDKIGRQFVKKKEKRADRKLRAQRAL
jgi:putative sigma-54 modulation protein